MSAVSKTKTEDSSSLFFSQSDQDASAALKGGGIHAVHPVLEPICAHDSLREKIQIVSKNSLEKAIENPLMDNHLWSIIGKFSPDGLNSFASASLFFFKNLDFILPRLPKEDLGEFLLNAVQRGDEDLVCMSIKSPRFSQIPQQEFEIAFEEAYIKDLPKIFKILTKTLCFNQISIQTLESVLIYAATKGNTEIFKALLASSRFSQMSIETLESALKNAAKNGSVHIFQALQTCSRFNEIPEETREIALKYAKLAGYEEALDEACDYDQASKKT